MKTIVQKVFNENALKWGIVPTHMFEYKEGINMSNLSSMN